MELIHIEPTRPRWAELASIHGIEVLDRSHVAIGFWEAEIELFGQVESELGESPREAVVRLIHRLKLTGWQEVTV